MSEDSDSIAARLSRRKVLRSIGASGVLLGGIGTVSASHTGQRGPPPGQGPGNENGRGGEKGNKGGEGGGPTHLTGGSGWMPGFPDTGVPTDDNPEDGPDARFEIGEPTGATVQYWAGCESVGDENVPTTTFKVYPVTWLDGLSGPTEIYLYQKKPVQPGVYNMVEAGECPAPEPTVAEVTERYWQVGYEPGVEHEEPA